ncbi:MAG: hypothetical protein D3919_14025, partial [Candidatus Electrothrix sp. AW5]|nr:hypothetical protein [Candidatus Electrothrix gigas]
AAYAATENSSQWNSHPSYDLSLFFLMIQQRKIIRRVPAPQGEGGEGGLVRASALPMPQQKTAASGTATRRMIFLCFFL